MCDELLVFHTELSNIYRRFVFSLDNIVEISNTRNVSRIEFLHNVLEKRIYYFLSISGILAAFSAIVYLSYTDHAFLNVTAMNLRKITSLTMLVSFVPLVLTNIILYIVPHGRVAYWADWHHYSNGRSKHKRNRCCKQNYPIRPV